MALFIVITTVLLSVYLARSMAVDETVCPQGTMFRPGTHGEPSRCEPCPVGTYNHKRHHRRTTCKSCTPFDSFDPYYTISRECTKDHNTVIKCIDGFYLIKSDHETPCLMCANCSLLGKTVSVVILLLLRLRFVAAVYSITNFVPVTLILMRRNLSSLMFFSPLIWHLVVPEAVFGVTRNKSFTKLIIVIVII